MSNVAYLPIEADRYGACVRQIYVRGLDLTGIAMRAQVRLSGDTPGDPEVDLQTVTNGNAEGLRLVGVIIEAGVPVSHVEMIINETTMEGLPYAGEIGSPIALAWDCQLTIGGRKQRLAKGEFIITGDGVTGADNAPVDRPERWSGSRMAGGGMRSGATLTFGDDVMSVSIDGMDLYAPLLANAGVAQAAADIATAAAFLTPVTVGKWTGTGDQVTAGQKIGIGYHHRQRAMLIGVKAQMNAPGTLRIGRAKATGDSDSHVQAGTSATYAHGAGTIVLGKTDIVAGNGGVPLVFEPGELPVVGSDGGLRYTASREPYWSLPTGLEAAPTLSFPALSLAATGATFDIELYFLFAPPADLREPVVFEEMTSFSTVPGTWDNGAGAATTGAGALYLGASGFGSMLATRRSYGLDRVRYELDVVVPTNSRLAIATDPTIPVDSGQMEGSLFAYEADNRRFLPYRKWDGGNALPATGPAIPITNPDGSAVTLDGGHSYRIIWEKVDRDQRLTFMDPTGPVASEGAVTWHNADGKAMNGYTAELGVGTKWGLMHGSLALQALAGAALINRLRVTADYDRFCDYLILGDSRTEGATVFIGERSYDRLAAQLGARRVAISGVGGATTIGGLNRLFVLLDAMRPRTVRLSLGTNGADSGDFAGNLALLVKLCRNAGARVEVETVPIDSGRSATIRGLDGVTVIDVQPALAPGAAPVPAYYAQTYQDTGAPYGTATGDGVHENAVGQARKARQEAR